ncbi:MAG: N-acetylmuramoyl-L-alanine amidase [Clostridiales bacterium]|nr:N-acetylmuramoyl-L-alanine amidase [Clostridiales bacterium]
MAIRIFIDQGHNPAGNVNAGASGNGLYEGDITFQVGLYLANLLNNDSRFEARLSRPNATTVLGTSNASSLQARVQMANDWPADYFISIHCNANVNPAINGTEVYIFQYGTQANWMAVQIMDGITQTVGTRNNGIRLNPTLYVLRRTTMTSLLVELGYLTNWSDAQKLRDNQWGFAYGMYLGIMRYFGFTPTQ